MFRCAPWPPQAGQSMQEEDQTTLRWSEQRIFQISRHFWSNPREFLVFGGISFPAPSPAPASDRSRRAAHRALPPPSPWPPRGAASISRWPKAPCPARYGRGGLVAGTAVIYCGT